MSWELVFHPDVEDEVREAYNWYEERKESLGDEFLAALETVYARLRATPEIHQVLEQNIRHSRLKRFPYAVYYRILGGTASKSSRFTSAVATRIGGGPAPDSHQSLSSTTPGPHAPAPRTRPAAGARQRG